MRRIMKKIKKLYQNLPIKRKLLLVFYVQILMPLILISYFSYNLSADIIYKKSVIYTQDILNTIEIRLTDYVDDLFNVSQSLLYDNAFYNILNGKDEQATLLRDYENETQMNNILKKVLLSRKEIQSICIISNSGYYFSADNNSNKTSIRKIVQPVREPMHQLAARNHGRGAWYLDMNGDQADNIFYVRTVYNRDDFSEIGMMVIMIKKEFFDNIYRELNTVDMQNVTVLSSDNRYIAGKSKDAKDRLYVTQPTLQNQMNGDSGSIIDNKANTLVSYVNMTDPSWRVISSVSLNLLYRDINNLRQWIIILSIVSISILSVFALYFSVDFINPINKLVRKMKKVQKGESIERIEGIVIDRADELGFLDKTFNEMAQEINHLVNWIYREQITRKEAQLKALQSQINPHFLFNTLESINWMAQLNHVPEISDTVTALSALMEASIGRDDRLISIQEEFKYIDNYILILKNRFEDRPTLEKNVQPEVLDVHIPRLLIQQLIENAVYHGIERMRTKGIIRLDATLTENGDVLIEVSDNGPGIESADLQMLNEKLAMDNDAYFRSLENSKRNGIGIENVNRRIKLFYGETYGLKVQSIPFEITRLIVRIPANRQENGGTEKNV